jgi:hypothetical protein
MHQIERSRNVVVVDALNLYGKQISFVIGFDTFGEHPRRFYRLTAPGDHDAICCRQLSVDFLDVVRRGSEPRIPEDGASASAKSLDDSTYLFFSFPFVREKYICHENAPLCITCFGISKVSLIPAANIDAPDIVGDSSSSGMALWSWFVEIAEKKLSTFEDSAHKLLLRAFSLAADKLELTTAQGQ